MASIPGYQTNFGTSQPFPSHVVPGGFLVDNNVQLVSARVPVPHPWVVTLMPVTTTAGRNVAPWAAPGFDGVVGATPTPPTVPVNEAGNGFKVIMTWGAGGVRGQAKFDYPMAGCVFGITADTLDIRVVVDGVPQTTYAALDDVPFFGAHMVPGQCSGGVRFTDVAQNAGATPAQHVAWTVKPYAKNLYVSRADPTNAAKLYSVKFFSNIPVDPIAETFTALDDGSQSNSLRPFMVPPQATFVQLQNSDPVPPEGAADLWRITWELFFA